MANQLRPNLDEQALLLAIIKLLSDGWVSPHHFDRLIKTLQIPAGEPSIYFLTGIQQIMRELPFKVFQDDHSRSAIIDALQTTIDNLIMKEETDNNTRSMNAAASTESSPIHGG